MFEAILNILFGDKEDLPTRYRKAEGRYEEGVVTDPLYTKAVMLKGAEKKKEEKNG